MLQHAQISRRIDRRKCIANICACRANQFDICYQTEIETVFNIDN